MSASATNMAVVVEAKRIHNESCPWGGEAKRVLLHPFDIERMGWEEGDVIAGVVVIADTTIVTGMLRVECDAEPNAGGPTIKEEIKDEAKTPVMVPA